MPILDLPPNPPSNPPSAQDPTPAAGTGRIPPARPLTGRYANLEEHELIHLLDAVDDEVARAAFRESVYKSIIICMAVAWFLVYGPKIILHQPTYKDPFAAIKEHDRAISLSLPRDVAPHPPAHAMPDRQTMKQLQQARPTPPAPTAPQQPAPQAQAQPQETARNTPPPLPPSTTQPQLPLPSAPTPRPQQQAAPVPDAPAPSPRIAQAGPTSSRDAMQDLIRNAHPGSGGITAPSPGSSGPIQAGAAIISDTQGVDFTAYLRRLQRDIQRNWEPLIPEEVRAPLLKKGVVGIRFIIMADGTISGPDHGQPLLETPSGAESLDRAAWGAIVEENQFPPLPKEFHGRSIELRVGFFYNTPVR